MEIEVPKKFRFEECPYAVAKVTVPEKGFALEYEDGTRVTITPECVAEALYLRANALLVNSKELIRIYNGERRVA